MLVLGRVDRMISIAPDIHLASDELSAILAGLRLLDDAIDEARQAWAEIGGLADAARWQSTGVRVLREALTELAATFGTNCSELDFHRDQLARVIW